MATIFFDLDGTLADLYGVPGWLSMLEAEDETPYAIAKPLLNLSTLARYINKARRNGYDIGIISWTSKGGSDEYNAKVFDAKCAWLGKHLPSVCWDSINIVDYGTPKENFAKSTDDILFDDEAKNRDNWTGIALDVDNIIGVLKMLSYNG